jgi:hypothetical protein
MHGTRRATEFVNAGALGLGERDQIYIFTPPAGVAGECTINEDGVLVLTLRSSANGPSVVTSPIAIQNPVLVTLTAGATLTVLE